MENKVVKNLGHNVPSNLESLSLPSRKKFAIAVVALAGMLGGVSPRAARAEDAPSAPAPAASTPLFPDQKAGNVLDQVTREDWARHAQNLSQAKPELPGVLRMLEEMAKKRPWLKAEELEAIGNGALRSLAEARKVLDGTRDSLVYDKRPKTVADYITVYGEKFIPLAIKVAGKYDKRLGLAGELHEPFKEVMNELHAYSLDEYTSARGILSASAFLNRDARSVSSWQRIRETAAGTSPISVATNKFLSTELGIAPHSTYQDLFDRSPAFATADSGLKKTVAALIELNKLRKDVEDLRLEGKEASEAQQKRIAELAEIVALRLETVMKEEATKCTEATAKMGDALAFLVDREKVRMAREAETESKRAILDEQASRIAIGVNTIQTVSLLASFSGSETLQKRAGDFVAIGSAYLTIQKAVDSFSNVQNLATGLALGNGYLTALSIVVDHFQSRTESPEEVIMKQLNGMRDMLIQLQKGLIAIDRKLDAVYTTMVQYFDRVMYDLADIKLNLDGLKNELISETTALSSKLDVVYRLELDTQLLIRELAKQLEEREQSWFLNHRKRFETELDLTEWQKGISNLLHAIDKAAKNPLVIGAPARETDFDYKIARQRLEQARREGRGQLAELDYLVNFSTRVLGNSESKAFSSLTAEALDGVTDNQREAIATERRLRSPIAWMAAARMLQQLVYSYPHYISDLRIGAELNEIIDGELDEIISHGEALLSALHSMVGKGNGYAEFNAAPLQKIVSDYEAKLTEVQGALRKAVTDWQNKWILGKSIDEIRDYVPSIEELRSPSRHNRVAQVVTNFGGDRQERGLPVALLSTPLLTPEMRRLLYVVNGSAIAETRPDFKMEVRFEYIYGAWSDFGGNEEVVSTEIFKGVHYRDHHFHNAKTARPRIFLSLNLAIGDGKYSLGGFIFNGPRVEVQPRWPMTPARYEHRGKEVYVAEWKDFDDRPTVPDEAAAFNSAWPSAIGSSLSDWEQKTEGSAAWFGGKIAPNKNISLKTVREAVLAKIAAMQNEVTVNCYNHPDDALIGAVFCASNRWDESKVERSGTLDLNALKDVFRRLEELDNIKWILGRYLEVAMPSTVNSNTAVSDETLTDTGLWGSRRWLALWDEKNLQTMASLRQAMLPEPTQFKNAVAQAKATIEQLKTSYVPERFPEIEETIRDLKVLRDIIREARKNADVLKLERAARGLDAPTQEPGMK